MFLLNMLNNKLKMPPRENALPGRANPLPTATHHFVNGTPIKEPFPEGMEVAMFGLGCFWGAERKFWELPGVYTTAAGYAAGHTPNPTYQEVCTGLTGHNEVVLVVYDPAKIGYGELVKAFFESHDPTQGMRQGNDVGTQYRSGIYVFNEEQRRIAMEAKVAYRLALAQAGRESGITTEVIDAPPFYYAEEYHQQYLAKNPNGYCGLGGTGVACPMGTGVNAA
jgi:peptide-methionine (S)-S-oxide reductase